MRKVPIWLICATVFLLFSSQAGAFEIDLTAGRGTTVEYEDNYGAVFIEFNEEMQSTVSSGTGVIDPFLTIQKKNEEEGFNSDKTPLVLDTTRPKWNHSLQIGDLVASPIDGCSAYYEFLLDINEPAATSLLTQTELEVYVVDNDDGGAIEDLSAYTPVWDLDALEDSEILYDYNLWSGSGQNIDAAFLLPTSLFSGFNADDFVYLYAAFEDSGAGFEEYVQRKGVAPIPEPATLFLLGAGLATLAGTCRKSLLKK